MKNPKAKPSKVVPFPKPYRKKPIEPKPPELDTRPPVTAVCGKQPKGAGFNPHLCPQCRRALKCWESYLKGFILVPYVLWDTHKGVLKPAEKVVFIELLRHTNNNPQSKYFAQCHKSVKELAAEAHISRNTVSDSLKTLLYYGLITRTPKLFPRKEAGTFGKTYVHTVPFLTVFKGMRAADKKGGLKEWLIKFTKRYDKRGDPIPEPKTHGPKSTHGKTTENPRK